MSTSIYYKNPDDELDFNGHKKNIVVIPSVILLPAARLPSVL